MLVYEIVKEKIFKYGGESEFPHKRFLNAFLEKNNLEAEFLIEHIKE